MTDTNTDTSKQKNENDQWFQLAVQKYGFDTGDILLYEHTNTYKKWHTLLTPIANLLTVETYFIEEGE